MNAPLQERTEPQFGPSVPFVETQQQMTLFADVANGLSSEASEELHQAQRQGLGNDAVVLARKRLSDALEQATLAAQALEAAYAAQAAHLQGTDAFLNNKPEQGTPFFDIAGQKIGKARDLFVAAIDKVATSPFLDRVLTRMEAADARITAGAVKLDDMVTRGATGFLSTMRRTAETMGKMVTAIKETPGRLIAAAKATGQNLSDTTAFYFEQAKQDLVDLGRDIRHDVTLMATATRDAAVKVGTVAIDGVALAAAAGVAAGTAVRDGAIVATEVTKQAVRHTADVGEAVVKTGSDVTVAAARATIDTGLAIGSQVVSGLKSRFTENLARAQARRDADAANSSTAAPAAPKTGM